MRRTLRVIVVLFLAMTAYFGQAGTPAAFAADAGYRDFSFSALNVSRPTGEKPQSKLWFNDGIWWGVLFNRSTEKYQIYRYDWTSHTWSDTGVVVDDRNNAKADVLWDGAHLYVATAGPTSTNSSHSARVLRYSYNPATKKYSRNSGFPVTISSGGMEAMVIAKDTTGKLWVTYTQNNNVYINHSLADDLTWGTPNVLPAGGTNVDPDDISSVIAFGGQIGVMWSNQIDDAFYLAIHKDGDPQDVWQSSTVLQGQGIADDHINLKADASGRVYAAVKTSLDTHVPNPDSSSPLNLLLVRAQDGSWTSHVFSRVGDNETRPMVLLDEEHRALYMFATAPCCNGGQIYYKQASLDNISFSQGRGVPFIQTATDLALDDVTSTKQNVDSATGMLVEASDRSSGYYVHNRTSLGPADTTPPSVQPPAQSFPLSATLDTSTVPVNLAWSATDEASGVSRYELQQSTNGGAYANVSLPTSTTTTNTRFLSPGNSYQFRVRAQDGAGNWSDWASGAQFFVSAYQESSGAISYVGSWTKEASSTAYGGGIAYAQAKGAKATFTFTGRDVAWVTTKGPDRGKAEVWVDGVKVKSVDLYSATQAPRKTVYVQHWTDSSTHTMEVRVLGTKNTSSTGTRVDLDALTELHSDITPPEVVGITPQDGTAGVPTTTNVEASFSEAMDEASLKDTTFTLTKRGSTTAVPATLSYDLTTKKATLDPKVDLSADTSYTATIKSGANGVKDVAGNALAAQKVWSFSTPDTTPPQTTIDSGPSAATNDNTPTFSYSATDGVTATPDLVYSYKLDGGEWSAYSAQASVTLGDAEEGLGEGSHSFYVKAKDQAGLEDPTPAERPFVVDTLAPDAPLITDPQEGSDIDTANFSLSGSAEPSSIVEIFEGTTSLGTIQAEASGAWSKTLSGVADGTHTYTAKATDAAANISSTSNTLTVTLSTGPPQTTIDSGPSGMVSSASASFSFSSSKTGSTYECSLDGASFSSCTSPTGYTGLADGPHTFEVRAIDASGNTDPTPASSSWSVDTAPTIVGVTPDDLAGNVALDTNVEVTFSEAMDPTTIDTSTFVLSKQGSNVPIAATILYDAASRKATLVPVEDLEAGITYTATIKGGASGLKDDAGNPLDVDIVWSFTTG